MTQWQQMLKNIQQEYFTHPNDFLTQPTISRTIHPRQPSLADRYVEYLGRDVFIMQAVLPFITDSKIGNPFTTCYNNKLSLTSVQNAYYIHHMKNLFNFNVSSVDSIVDIGGGYGNMARVMIKLGFSGSYSIIDFPTMHMIQRWFLTENGVENVKLRTLKQSSFESVTDDSLLLATFSMNEMPLDDRQIIEDNARNFKYLFIAHNRNFDGIDNINYFNSLKSRLSDTFKIQQFICPVNQSHRYFVGRKYE